MKYTILLAALLLTGCTTVPLKSELPELPEEFSKPCGPLQTVQGSTATLKEFTEVVVRNYGLYHECAATHSGLVEWYKRQRSVAAPDSK